MTESKTGDAPPKSPSPASDEPVEINLNINIVALDNTSDDEDDLRRQSNPVEVE